MDKTLVELLETSHYQTFDFLDGRKRDSDSADKWNKSKLQEYDLLGASVLDIGCNAGYFVFRLLSLNPAEVIGIDGGQKWIDIANGLNKKHFKSDIVQFICEDFFKQAFSQKFALIICFSTFHYMSEQEKFFWKVKTHLSDGGILLLEVEESPHNCAPCVDRASRPSDNARHYYPNSLQIEKWIEGKFEIKEKYLSTHQGGSVYERYFYKLQKI